MKEVVEITKEYLDTLDPFDRVQAVRKRQRWLKDVRTQDREVANKQMNKKRRFRGDCCKFFHSFCAPPLRFQQHIISNGEVRDNYYTHQ